MRKTTGKPNQGTQQEFCLKQICLQSVRDNVATLEANAILDLPTPLIKDLIPYLTVCQLDELQPALNLRGISTHPGWVRVLQDICGPHDSIALYTEEEAKLEAMRILFTSKFYGFARSVADPNAQSVLRAAAKCVRQFALMANCHEPLRSLAAEQRPLLDALEKRVGSVSVSQPVDVSEAKSQIALYVLHRLLDHGAARTVAVHVPCPALLAWLLRGRGSPCGSSPDASSSSSEDHGVVLRKRPKLDSASAAGERGTATPDERLLCRTFAPPGRAAAEVCPRGPIRCLEVTRCRSDSLRELNAALPTFFSLASLTLHSFSTFRDSDVLDLARALKRLTQSACSSLAAMSIGVLPCTSFLEVLLDANPKVTSLQVEIQTVTCGHRFPSHHPRTADAELSELPLEKLTLKVAEIETDLHAVTSVLRRSPRLASLHVAGLRLPSGSSQSRLLATLSEVNLCLRSLTLEDMKLSDCLPEILHLLSSCRLEELQLNDCRLLEKWTDKEASLKQLVVAVRAVASLHTLGLAQNRLGRNTRVLAELFSGHPPASVKRLNISSNFIKPDELLEFAKRLKMHHPPHRLTLDVRRNPGDRDPRTWNAALKKLNRFCLVVVEGWKSTDTMVDHISNM